MLTHQLCDLFLVLIADSVYDSRSRAFLELVARALGFEWVDVVRFENRVTDALEIQEAVEKSEQGEIIEGRRTQARRRRYAYMGLAAAGASPRRSVVRRLTMLRWRSCHWSVCWSTCTRHWSWARGGIRDGGHFRNYRFPGWSRWCSHDHHHGSLDRCQYRRQGYGETYARSPDIRI